MSLDIHSHRTQVLFAALAASAATFGLVSAYNQHSKHQRRKELDAEIRQSLTTLPGTSHSRRNGKQQDVEEKDAHITLGTGFRAERGFGYDEELVREQLARNYAFFGEEGMSRVRAGTVVIIGCGGVGSWAAVMLARSCVLRRMI